MKKILKKYLILLTIFLSIITINATILATDSTEPTPIISIGDIISQGKSFLADTTTEGIGIDGKEVENAAESIYNILLGVGIIVTMAISVFLGAKFIMASAEEKADIKQSMLPFIIGTFVMFGAFGIWRILLNMLSGLET